MSTKKSSTIYAVPTSTSNPVQPVNPIAIVAGSLTVVAGLAWNTAILSIINEYYGDQNEKDSVQAKVVYALVVTLFIVIAVFVLSYINQQAEAWDQKLDQIRLAQLNNLLQLKNLEKS
jgi:uncharacterized BrkB/YihY/UPF0761 family membrane protein